MFSKLLFYYLCVFVFCLNYSIVLSFFLPFWHVFEFLLATRAASLCFWLVMEEARVTYETYESFSFVWLNLILLDVVKVIHALYWFYFLHHLFSFKYFFNEINFFILLLTLIILFNLLLYFYWNLEIGVVLLVCYRVNRNTKNKFWYFLLFSLFYFLFFSF